jgi:uncharacterized protein (TIGR02118 family)
VIKLSYCLRRRPIVARVDFQHYWRITHAPLVADAVAALGVRRYIQSHTIETPIDAAIAAARGCGVEAYDGVAELWWDDEASLMAGMASQAGQAAAAILLADEAKFIDFPRSAIFFGREHLVIGTPAAA